MSDNVIRFKEALDRVKLNNDICFNNLRNNVELKLDSKAIGDLFIAYNKVQKIGNIDAANMDSKLYVNEFKQDVYFIESKRNVKVNANNSIVSNEFELYIIHKLRPIYFYDSTKISLLVEQSIESFIITEYGCFDIIKRKSTNISDKEAFLTCFTNKEIFICPSRISKFFYDLKLAVSNVTYEQIFRDNMHKLNINFSFNPIPKTSHLSDDFIDIYVDNKLLGTMLYQYSMLVDFVIYTKEKVMYKFKSSTSIFGKRTRATVDFIYYLYSKQFISCIDKVLKFDVINEASNIPVVLLNIEISQLKSKLFFKYQVRRIGIGSKSLLEKINSIVKSYFSTILVNEFKFNLYIDKSVVGEKIWIANNSLCDSEEHGVYYYLDNVYSSGFDLYYRNTVLLIDINGSIISISVLENLRQIFFKYSLIPMVYFEPIYVCQAFYDYDSDIIENAPMNNIIDVYKIKKNYINGIVKKEFKIGISLQTNLENIPTCSNDVLEYLKKIY